MTAHSCTVYGLPGGRVTPDERDSLAAPMLPLLSARPGLIRVATG